MTRPKNNRCVSTNPTCAHPAIFIAILYEKYFHTSLLSFFHSSKEYCQTKGENAFFVFLFLSRLFLIYLPYTSKFNPVTYI